MKTAPTTVSLAAPGTATNLEPAVLARLTRHVSLEEIPPAGDLLSAEDLSAYLATRAEPPLDLIVGGDIMLAGRARPLLEARGQSYPFAAVRPLLDRAALVLANLEGPLASDARREQRRFSYRVSPHTTEALTEAGIHLLTLANNHLMDCGADGVTETLEILRRSRIRAIGAGADPAAAHAPAIFPTANGTVGVLGYYWNRRCAATGSRPGGATDDPAWLERDITALRPLVDFLLVTSHWGVPYQRAPGPEERARAHLAIDLGADAIVAHHPHVIQACEIYRGCPIFYSVGNFAFGSGNTQAEGLLVGFRCQPRALTVEAYPLYVKNRDPRVDYQPKVMRGASARRALAKLAPLDAPGSFEWDGARAILRLRLRRDGAGMHGAGTRR